MIRLAAGADAHLLASIHAAAFPEDPWPALGFMTLLADPLTDGLLAGDEATGPGGLALVRSVAGESELLTIGVVPRARGRGLGRLLVGAALDLAARRGSTVMFLEVAEDNYSAIRLYTNYSFREVGRRPGYYRRRSGSMAALILRSDNLPLARST